MTVGGVDWTDRPRRVDRRAGSASASTPTTTCDRAPMVTDASRAYVVGSSSNATGLVFAYDLSDR
jgi:hypothetical protein